MKLKDYFDREKKAFIFGGSVFVGLFLWINHYIAFGSLSFWDSFPSHESTGFILVLFGFIGIFSTMFDFSFPDWLKEKNNKKVIGRIINKIVNTLKKR